MTIRQASSAIVVGLFAVASLAAWKAAEANGSVRYEPDTASSRLTVEGTSTIHDWKVESRAIGGELSLQEQEFSSLWTDGDPASHVLSPTVRVEIPVTSLKSGKRGMDQNMHAALKAPTHPMIIYRLESAEIRKRQANLENRSGENLTIETKGVLTVAGIGQSVDIPMQVRRLADNRLEISGEISLRMTKFGIDPPRAMLGAIRTGDEIYVGWTWVLVRDRFDNRDGP